MDSASAYRLVYALAGAGFFLLLLEIFLTGMGMGVFGALALLTATGIAFYGCSIDVGSVLLLISITAISIGTLVVITCFPGTPLGRRILQEAALKEEARVRDEAKDSEED